MKKIDFFISCRRLIRTGLCVVGLLFGLTASAQEVVVVENLANYTGTDQYVYNKADGRTYARNNLGDYELYGVYEKVTSLKINDPSAAVQDAEYIQSNGGYINLGYLPKKATRIEAVYECAEGPEWKALYGTRFEANTQNGVEFPGIGGYSAGNGWKYGFAFFPTNGMINLGDEVGGKDNMRFNEKLVTVQDAALGTLEIYSYVDGENDEYITTITDTPMPGDCETSLYILAINKHLPVIDGYNTNPDAFGANSDPCINTWAKLYSLKIYEGESLLKYDLVPVLSEGKGALKDILTGTIYKSANGEDLIAGGVDGGTGTTVYPGKMVYNTTDQKTYKYNGTTKQFELVGDGSRTLEEIASTDYKDLNNWVTNDGHKAIFNGKWQETANGYKIDPYVGTGGHEPLMTQVALEPASDYNFSFTSSWGAYNSWHNTEMHAYVCNFWDLGTTESGLDVSGSVLATQTFSFDGGEDVDFSLDFTADRENQTLVLQFGDVDDGEKTPAFWFEFDNMSVKKYVYPEAYPVLNPYAPRINDLLSQIDSYDAGTTDALQSDLDAAIADANSALAGDALDVQKDALDALQTAFDKAKTITGSMINVLNQAAALAKADGVNVSSETETFGTEGTEVDTYNTLLNKVRVDRKVAHIEKDNATYTGNEPAEGEFYLYNVGRKAYLTNGSDWGTHAVLGWPGLEATLATFGDGYSIQFNELIQGDARDKFLNGSPYCDGADGDKGSYVFEPVDGKTNVYNIRTDRGYLAFDPDGAVDGGGIKHYNTVTAMWASPANEDAEWMLVTKDDRLAQVETATNDNPVDVTVVIKDASFNKYAALENPWEGLNQGWEWGNRDFGDKNTEFYRGDADIDPYGLTQEIELPKEGWYVLTVQGYFRDEERDPFVEKIVNDEPLAEEPVVYVGMNDEAPLKYIHEEANKAPGEGTDTAIGNIPGNMIEAAKFFENGLYTNIIKFEATASELDGVAIGVDEVEQKAVGSWIVLDNFRLKYYGTEEPDLSGINNAVVEQEARSKGQNAVYDLYGRKVANGRLSGSKLPKGIYIVGGKKVAIK